MLFERERVTIPFFKLQMWPLLEKHYKEISAFQDIPLDPDFETYVKMEEMNTLRCYCVRDNEDNMALVGYQIFFINKNIHYQSSLQAVQDVLFIERSKRGSGVGQSFIDWCDHELAKTGVELVYQHVKVKFDFGPMLEKIGYKKVENIYARDLRGLAVL